jgi:spoIIIJ-associated protein
VEWVEVKGPSVEVAVEAAMAELGIKSRDEVDVEVLQEPEKGFLGIGRTDAVVRVKPLPKKRRRKRPAGGKRRGEQPRGNQRGQSGQGRDQRKKPGQRQQQRSGQDKATEKRRTETRPSQAGGERDAAPEPRERTVSREEQASVVGEFLEGLLDAFGLEGRVETRVDEDIIYADVVGSETEALVGSRGVILQSIHELAKTVVQRKTQESARIRLDIAGYSERRREALKIYAQRLGQQILDEGGEIMVEPMNAAERKIIHDTIGEIEGVRTYSEGEEPRRSVVIAAEDE